MSVYHIRLAKGCNADSEGEIFNYFGVDVDCCEVLIGVESVLESY
jgi:hypothetical protein